METTPGAALVRAAQAGDRRALETLLGAYLPLVYNVVGRALNGHPDTDDVVQQTMLNAIQGLAGLREPERFRSWLISIAYRQIHELGRTRGAALARHRPLDDRAEAAHPIDDFAEATIVRLGLSGQRRALVEATRLLDRDSQRVIALWWQELAGSLTRAEVAAALALRAPHAAVRIHRARAQLDLARAVLVAWRADPRCPGLVAAARGRPGGRDRGGLPGLDGPDGPDGRYDPRWLRRLGRHVRDCELCGQWGRDLAPVERLLPGIALLPVPHALAGRLSALVGAGHGAGPALAAPAAGAARRLLRHLSAKHAAVGATALAAAAAVLVYAVFYQPGPDPAPAIAAPPPVTVPAAAGPTSATASPASASPSVSPPSATPSATVTAPVSGVTSADIFVATGGSDGGDGSIAHPYATLSKAVSVVRPGQTIALRGGLYRPTVPVTITTSGTSARRIVLSNYRDEHPVIDATGIPADKWYVTQQASYWTVRGLEIKDAPSHPYVCESCRSDIFTRLSIHDSGDSALILRGDSTTDNQVLDSDFYGNHDDATHGENADGLDLKFGSGTGNVVRRCRTFDNADDGVDFTEFTSPVTVEDVWSYGNGVNRWGIAGFTGDGDGFKLGGGDPAASVDHTVTGSAAWDNASYGFSENGNAGRLTLSIDTAYHNGSAGFAFTHSSSTLRGNLSLANAGSTGSATGAGDVMLGDAVTASGNSWNQSGWSVSALRSTDPAGARAARRPDGSLPATTFLTNTKDPAIGAPMS
ncbi:hypothetical protein GCM10023322_34620 [Rugosimonospora acidiphila]|uniref:RNA polymerase sigma factor n=1 Tax=Rugosimonospora acidiphila TaxID=556531 RepID=A0ABP9RVZ8_9ACTN